MHVKVQNETKSWKGHLHYYWSDGHNDVDADFIWQEQVDLQNLRHDGCFCHRRLYNYTKEAFYSYIQHFNFDALLI